MELTKRQSSKTNDWIHPCISFCLLKAVMWAQWPKQRSQSPSHLLQLTEMLTSERCHLSSISWVYPGPRTHTSQSQPPQWLDYPGLDGATAVQFFAGATFVNQHYDGRICTNVINIHSKRKISVSKLRQSIQYLSRVQSKLLITCIYFYFYFLIKKKIQINETIDLLMVRD